MSTKELDWTWVEAFVERWDRLGYDVPPTGRVVAPCLDRSSAKTDAIPSPAKETAPDAD